MRYTEVTGEHKAQQLCSDKWYVTRIIHLHLQIFQWHTDFSSIFKSMFSWAIFWKSCVNVLWHPRPYKVHYTYIVLEVLHEEYFVCWWIFNSRLLPCPVSWHKVCIASCRIIKLHIEFRVQSHRIRGTMHRCIHRNNAYKKRKNENKWRNHIWNKTKNTQ